ncbi:MAG: hypothetical protein ACRC2T_06030 [Thermoguttaceae bacterium]
MPTQKTLNTKHLSILAIVLLAPAVVIGEQVTKSKKTPVKGENEYVRVFRPEGKKIPQSLDTAIVRFEGKNKKTGNKDLTVDLVSAVHFADKEYYEELNKRFKEYDVVLFELVIPEGMEINEKTFSKERREKRGGLLSMIQEGMGESLDLSQQLEHVDYTAKNFVHADLTLDAFLQRVSDRNDISNTFSRAFTASLAKQNSEGSGKMEGRLVATLFAKNKTLALKRAFADEMVSQMELSAWIFSGDDGSAIITDRNAVALKELRKAISEGKTKIAIFYGAAHLVEFAKSLEKDFGLKPTETIWLNAWDLTSEKNLRNSKK